MAQVTQVLEMIRWTISFFFFFQPFHKERAFNVLLARKACVQIKDQSRLLGTEQKCDPLPCAPLSSVHTPFFPPEKSRYRHPRIDGNSTLLIRAKYWTTSVFITKHSNVWMPFLPCQMDGVRPIHVVWKEHTSVHLIYGKLPRPLDHTRPSTTSTSKKRCFRLILHFHLLPWPVNYLYACRGGRHTLHKVFHIQTSLKN